MSAPLVICCQRCDKPVGDNEPVRITIRQIANSITILRLVCPDCAKDFTRWWLEGIAGASTRNHG